MIKCIGEEEITIVHSIQILKKLETSFSKKFSIHEYYFEFNQAVQAIEPQIVFVACPMLTGYQQMNIPLPDKVTPF